MKKTIKNKLSSVNKKMLTILITVISVVLLAGIVAGAVAILRDTAGSVTETLSKAEVTCEVNDDWSVTNTSNIPALIRVKVIVNKTDGDEIIPGDVPAYTVGSDWTQIGEYLYYKGILTEAGGNKTTTSPAIVITPDDDTQVLVLAEAIQAASTAASEEWRAVYSDGGWS